MEHFLYDLNLANFGRQVNLILGIVLLIWLMYRRIRYREVYGGHLRNDMWLIAFYWTSASVVGTFEQLYDTGTSTRIILSFAALVITARLLWRNRGEWLEVREEIRRNGERHAAS